MIAHRLQHWMTVLGVMMARPWAFAILLLYAVAWIVLEPQTLDLHGVATLATWLMTLFIQRAEHRDTQAIQAKLDELLRAEGRAHDGLTRLDEDEPEDIERVREEARRAE